MLQCRGIIVWFPHHNNKKYIKRTSDSAGSRLFTNDVINLKHQGSCQKLMIGWHRHHTVCWKVTNCTSSWALSIAPAVHYCTHDVLMNTKTTFKFLLCWAGLWLAQLADVWGADLHKVRMSTVRCSRVLDWNLLFVYSVRAWHVGKFNK